MPPPRHVARGGSWDGGSSSSGYGVSGSGTAQRVQHVKRSSAVSAMWDDVAGDVFK
jgi:hypothetical protein